MLIGYALSLSACALIVPRNDKSSVPLWRIKVFYQNIFGLVRRRVKYFRSAGQLAADAPNVVVKSHRREP